MKTATKLLALPKNKQKSSAWEKAAGLLQSKKNIILREVAKNRKTWGVRLK